MTLASKRLKIDLKQKDKAELSPIKNETADGTNFIIEPKQDNTKPMNEDILKGMAAYSMSRPAKKIEYIQQVGRKGSAFPMVAQMPENQGMLEAQELKNRAAGPQNRKMLENNPNIMQPDNKISASKFGQEKLMSSIASDPGIPSPQPTSSMSSGVGSGVGQATNATPPTNYGDMVQDQSANQYDDLYAGAGSTPQTSTFGMYGKNTKITKKNVNSAMKDDAAHASYLKRDVKYDAKHGGSNEQMLNDEKHISKLYGDMKYDSKKKKKYDNV